MLRLDWNILFNMINILILFLLMKRFLFKPVNNILEKRQAEADAKLQEARQAQEEAAKSKKDYEESIKGAKEESAALVAQAKTDAVAEYQRILDSANQKADNIVEKAMRDAEQEKEKILQQAQSDVKDLVIDAVTRVTGKVESEKSDSVLYDEFLDLKGV